MHLFVNLNFTLKTMYMCGSLSVSLSLSYYIYIHLKVDCMHIVAANRLASRQRATLLVVVLDCRKWCYFTFYGSATRFRIKYMYLVIAKVPWKLLVTFFERRVVTVLTVGVLICFRCEANSVLPDRSEEHQCWWAQSGIRIRV